MKNGLLRMLEVPVVGNWSGNAPNDLRVQNRFGPERHKAIGPYCAAGPKRRFSSNDGGCVKLDYASMRARAQPASGGLAVHTLLGALVF